MSQINTISMDKCRSAAEVRELLREKAGDGQMAMLLWEDEVVCAAVPLEAAKEQLCQTVLERWSGNPEFIGDLLHRLRSEEPEDWK